MSIIKKLKSQPPEFLGLVSALLFLSVNLDAGRPDHSFFSILIFICNLPACGLGIWLRYSGHKASKTIKLLFRIIYWMGIIFTLSVIPSWIVISASKVMWLLAAYFAALIIPIISLLRSGFSYIPATILVLALLGCSSAIHTATSRVYPDNEPSDLVVPVLAIDGNLERNAIFFFGCVTGGYNKNEIFAPDWKASSSYNGDTMNVKITSYPVPWSRPYRKPSETQGYTTSWGESLLCESWGNHLTAELIPNYLTVRIKPEHRPRKINITFNNELILNTDISGEFTAKCQVTNHKEPFKFNCSAHDQHPLPNMR